MAVISCLPGRTGTLAAGFWHHMIWVDHSEQAVLKILWAVHPTAVKLKGGEERIGGGTLIAECLFVHWPVFRSVSATIQHED